jgi:hypothetical protein
MKLVFEVVFACRTFGGRFSGLTRRKRRGRRARRKTGVTQRTGAPEKGTRRKGTWMDRRKTGRWESNELHLDERDESFAPAGAIWEKDVIVRWGPGYHGLRDAQSGVAPPRGYSPASRWDAKAGAWKGELACGGLACAGSTRTFVRVGSFGEVPLFHRPGRFRFGL